MEPDPKALNDLVERFPGLPRSRVELAYEVYGPDMAAVEAALQSLATAEAMRVLRDGQAPLT